MPESYDRVLDMPGLHGETANAKHTVRLFGVAMAGRDVYEPYKD